MNEMKLIIKLIIVYVHLGEDIDKTNNLNIPLLSF